MAKVQPAVDSQGKGSLSQYIKERKGSGSKYIRSIEIERAADGGHIVTHRFSNTGGQGVYHEPEPFAFSKSDGGKVLAHLAKHLKITNPSAGMKSGGQNKDEGGSD